MKSDMLRISFQDPDGFVFGFNNKIYRLVLSSYAEDLLVVKNLGVLDSPFLVKHKEVSFEFFPEDVVTWLHGQIDSGTFLTVFELDKIEFISYPWEWTPPMLQAAAQFTLVFQKSLLQKGLSLKDASFYNIQFINGAPIFIDLLSIKIAGTKVYPWFAYGQFLQHFVFPLVMVKYKRFDSLQFLQAYPDGISKAEVSRHVSFRSYFSAFELFHIHLFKHLDKEVSPTAQQPEPSVDIQKLQLANLISFAAGYTKTVVKQYSLSKAHWVNYYKENTTAAYTDEKEKAFNEFLTVLPAIERAVDLGANTGYYSELLLQHTNNVLSVEMDNICCEILAERAKKINLPNAKWQIICCNLLHPSPGIGWLNSQRKSLVDRARAPLITALALIHHIYFSGSIEFTQIAELFNMVSTNFVIVEFIAKEDDKVMLLSQKNDTRLSFYTEDNFKMAMSRFFSVQTIKQVSATRSLFLYYKKDNES